MYSKVVLPLDGTPESEAVIASIQDDIASDATLILLQVVPPVKTMQVGTFILDSGEVMEGRRSEALDYLRGVVRRMEGDPERWRCEVVVSESIDRGIVDFAMREKVDLIAMYTHDRKGLAKLVKGSIARNVQRRASIEVKVVKPTELASA